jgi:hypothetical protein
MILFAQSSEQSMAKEKKGDVEIYSAFHIKLKSHPR